MVAPGLRVKGAVAVPVTSAMTPAVPELALRVSTEPAVSWKLLRAVLMVSVTWVVLLPVMARFPFRKKPRLPRRLLIGVTELSRSSVAPGCTVQVLVPAELREPEPFRTTEP